MLATLPAVSVLGIANQKNRIFSLVRTPVFGQSILSGNGQGPEKPVVEEREVEEEVFTFAYPEERGEISDIVSPPVEGIAGEVLHNKSGTIESSNVGASSDILPYVFVRNSDRKKTLYDSQPEFVSLTRQPEIAGSYVGLLVYSGYAASNFSYTSDEAYESPSLGEAIVYESNKSFYESKVPMPMISKGVDYIVKDKGELYVRERIEPQLQTYQNMQEEVKVQPVITQLVDVQYSNVPDLNSKLDYNTLDSVKMELPFLDLNVENSENKVLPLQEHSYDVKGLNVPLTIEQVRPDAVNIPKYDAKPRVKYETAKDVVTLPVNLGFDDTLIRDRFIEGLKAQIIETGQQDVNLPEIVDRNVLKEAYANLKDDTNIKDRIKAKGYEVIRDEVKLFNNLDFKGMEFKPDAIEEPTFQYDTKPLDFSLDQPVMYERARVDLDPFALFNLRSEVQTVYQGSIGVRDILLPRAEYNARSNLYNLVRVSYDNGRIQSFSQAASNYNSHLVNAQLEVEGALTDDADYNGVPSEQSLEEAVEQEKELIEEKPDENIESEVYDDNAAQDEAYEKSELNEEAETNESSGSSVGYVAAVAGAVGVGALAALLSPAFSLLKGITESDSDNSAEYLQEEETKQENPKENYGTKKCGSVSAKDSEYEISSDFAKTTQLDGEKSKKLCFQGIEEKSIGNEDFAKTSLQDSDKEGTKKFCFMKITEGDNGYLNIDGVDYKSYSTLSVKHGYIKRLQNNPEKSIINVRGKNGGDLTAQYEVSNKSIIAAFYAYAMDDTEDGGKGLTLDVRLDRDLERYEILDEGRLMLNGIFGLDDFDSQYAVQAVKRDEFGKVIERFFPRGEDGEFLSLEQELPDLYKDYDIELVRLESKGEKEWQKPEDINSILSEINQDSQRRLENGGYAPVLSQLKDENGEAIGRAYLVGDKFQITQEDVAMQGLYNVRSNRAVDKNENANSVYLNGNGLLAILDRKLGESGLNAIHKTMPTQKNRAVLNDNEVYMKGIGGLNEQLAKIHSYVPKERWSMLIVEEDPLTGELLELGYNPEKGTQFTPEVGKNYRIIVGDGSDISRARVKMNSIDYQNVKQSEAKRAEPIPV